MKFKLHDVLLKSIPYLLSVAGGATLFLLTADNIKNENLADLINNIAASLLAIPLVFLLYDYSNYRISRQLNKTLADNMNDKINSLLINIFLSLRKMMGMRGKISFETLNKMADLRTNEIAARLKITPALVGQLRTYHADLDNLIYTNAKNNILTLAQIQALSDVARDIGHLINEHSFHKDKKVVAKYIENILGLLTDWMDADADASLDFGRLVGGAVANQTGNVANAGK